MATMPNFITRLLRPFSQSTRLSLNPDTASMSIPPTAEKCTVAAGCFWGVEHMYRRAFPSGLYSAKVGYIGGDTASPSYRSVCSGRTGHAEALQITYDPEQISYRTLIEFLYKMHDPTTKDAQGPDRGSQYRSGIFWHNEEQKKVAEEITRKVDEQWWGGPGKVKTQVLEAGTWWDAEDYHQRYLEVNPSGYECPSHYLRKFPDLK